MNRTPNPHMHDPADKEIHRKEGVDPYPVPRQAETAARPADDETTSTPDNSFERGEEHTDGDYLDAVDKMKKTLKEEGDLEDWRKGRTQGAPGKH
jgi:hypothetical protein